MSSGWCERQQVNFEIMGKSHKHYYERMKSGYGMSEEDEDSESQVRVKGS